jgi:hypothetical protein
MHEKETELQTCHQPDINNNTGQRCVAQTLS